MHYEITVLSVRALYVPPSLSDKRRWLSFRSGGCENLFRVIESAEQKRQTSALKSHSA